MSLSNSININLNADAKSSDIETFLDCSLNTCWSINDYGGITYFIGDDFDYKSAIIEEKEKIINLLKDAIEHGVRCGITLVDKETNSGGELLFIDQFHLTFIISINKIFLEDGCTVNYEFYKEKLVACLKNFIASIEYLYN